MKRVRGVGAAAAGVAVVVVLAGCSGGDGEPKSETEQSADAVWTDEDQWGDTNPPPSSDPLEELAEESADPVYASGPEGDFDKMADEKGWVVDSSLYASASEYVDDICTSMTSQSEVGTEPGEWLATRTEPDSAVILKAGMPKLCPKWSKVALAALNGDYVRTYSGGTYIVKRKPKDPDPSSDEPQEIAPGTYRTKGDLEDCYWERTTRSGEIIDNNFATSAQVITVTIRASDGQFTSEGCGTWKPVK
ncbi:hypothetical protein ACWF94_06260 [Streptomyces sp. NPDC055078]